MPEPEATEKLIELLEEDSTAIGKAERTRLKIMASAAEVFNEKGFSSASIQDIADNAGIAKGTIYYYVDKKEDLLVMLLSFGKNQFFSKIEKAFEKTTTASQKIEAIVRNHLKMIRVIGPVMPFVVQNIVLDSSAVKDLMGDVRKRYLAVISEAIEEGIASGEFRKVDAKKTAVAILGMIIGQIMQHKAFNGKINSKEIADTTLDMVLRGLRLRHED